MFIERNGELWIEEGTVFERADWIMQCADEGAPLFFTRAQWLDYVALRCAYRMIEDDDE